MTFQCSPSIRITHEAGISSFQSAKILNYNRVASWAYPKGHFSWSLVAGLAKRALEPESATISKCSESRMIKSPGLCLWACWSISISSSSISELKQGLELGTQPELPPARYLQACDLSTGFNNSSRQELDTPPLLPLLSSYDVRSRGAQLALLIDHDLQGRGETQRDALHLHHHGQAAGQGKCMIRPSSCP